ncbi:hypothetical protein ACFRSX_32920 [Streptomyces goshikiensis]|uniref:hypothetical protein n=1 Tax=Streptomyces TaxID=1883 RepID=UPI0018FEBD53|nr:hypothetical protein [Streptomyces sp. CB02120-2]
MDIQLTIRNVTPEAYDDLKEFLSKHAERVTLDTEWTPERAERYYRQLPDRARKIVRAAAIRDGYVSADDLRDTEDSSLRGHSTALKQVLERGERKGWWPPEMPAPIEPQGKGFGKVDGYRMPDDLVGVFFTAIKKVSNQMAAVNITTGQE